MPLPDEVKAAIDAAAGAFADGTKKLTDRLGEIEKRVNRPGALHGDGGSPGGPSAEDVERKDAFLGWIRRGDDRQLKAMSVGSDPDGGYGVVPMLAQSIYTVARDIDPMRQYARVVPISKGDAFEEVQDQAQAFGASWASETGTRGDTSNAQVGKLRIPAHEIYAQPKTTQQLLDDSVFDVEAWVTSKVGEQFAISVGSAGVAGDGVGKPRGFTTYPTAATVDASRGWGTFEHIVTGTNASFGTGAAGAEKLIDVAHSLKPAYRARASWFMSRATAGNVRKLKDDSGRFVWTESLQQGQPPLLLGYPVVEMEGIPSIGTGSLAIWFGAMNPAYTIVDRLPATMLRDPFTDKPYVKFYTTLRTGGDVSDFHALKALKFST